MSERQNALRLNTYTCQACSKSITTIDEDHGVTPFMLACRATDGCRGFMRSHFYSGEHGVPSFVWRRPTPDEYGKASRAMREHFDQGGLDIHPVVGVHFTSTACNDGEHKWNGPVVERDTPYGGAESSATCSKCGMEFGHWMLWNAP